MTEDKPTVRVHPATYQPSKAEIEEDVGIDTDARRACEGWRFSR